MKKNRFYLWYGRLLVLFSIFVMSELHSAATPHPDSPRQCYLWQNLLQPVKPWQGDKALAPLYLYADSIIATERGDFILDGNVSIQRAEQILETEAATYKQHSSQVMTRGKTRFQEGGFALTGHTATFVLDRKQGSFDDVEFFMTDIPGRGSAETLVIDNQEIVRLQQARYTSCQPGNDDWYLNAPEIKLNQKEAIGTTYNVVLKFKQVPILYLPYLSFPLNDQRKSGILAPRFVNSKKSGVQISIPYYWNIAPAYDLTITPVFMARRGLQIKNEFRYLSRIGSGTFQADFLPQDKVYGKSRTFYSYKHSGVIIPGWKMDMRFNQVSDTDYFEDLGGSLTKSSIRYVERRLDLSHSGDLGRLKIRLQNHQIVDKNLSDAARPYQRLPQITYYLPQQRYGPFLFDTQSELVRFDRDGRINAVRFDIQPKVTLSLAGQAGFFRSGLTLRHTRYSLSCAVTDESAKSLVRTIPIISLDGGLFFDRDTSWGERRLLHTLEPRLFYLNAPFLEQTDLPIFDTAIPSMNFSRLFQENRFSGTDRVGDANQLTVALTSRLLGSDNGTEYLSARIGQIQYFRDRRVMLSQTGPETQNRSEVLADITFRLTNNWNGKTELRWQPQTDRLYKKTIQLQYKPDSRRIVNLGYRFEDERQKQVDISFFWQLSNSWSAVGRWNYSQHDRHLLEALAGLEYNSCCWSARVLSQRFLVDSAREEYDESLSFQLELKGLSAIGHNIREILERGILGYKQ